MTDFPSRIMSKVPDPVAYLDVDLRYRYSNQSYQQLFGMSGGECSQATDACGGLQGRAVPLPCARM